MGEDLSLRKYRYLREGRRIEVLSAGTTSLTVEVIRNNSVIKSDNGERRVQIDFFDDTVFDDIALKDTKGKRFIFYYIRVTQENEHQAWSSPIWISE